MLEYKETADDLARKYHQTFILYDKKLAYIHHFTEMGQVPGEQIAATISIEKGGDNSMLINPDLIEPISINTMFINNVEFREVKHTQLCPVVLICRKPKRQWRRGICNDNTLVRSPINNLYQAINKPLAPWDSNLGWALLQRVLNPTYPSLPDACKFAKHYIACAISQMFTVTLSNISEDKYLLMSTFGIIGQCTPDRIWVHHAPALQEVRDYVTRTKQLVQVEIAHA